jgi:hypothetical protein
MRRSKILRIFISFHHATGEFLQNTDRQNEKKSGKAYLTAAFWYRAVCAATDSNCGSDKPTACFSSLVTL